MAINIFSSYGPVRAGAPTVDYPVGFIKNESVPGAGDGTPLDQAWGNDYAGFDAALFSEVSVTPSGNPDTAVSSQRLNALKLLMGKTSNITFSSVADMKSGSNKVTAAIIDSNDILCSTIGYYGDWAAAMIPIGGTEYILTTTQRVRDALSDPTWVPDGFGDHYLFGGTDYVAVLALLNGRISVDHFGALGNGVDDDTTRVNAALSYGVPVVTIQDRTYMIDADVSVLVNSSTLLKGSGSKSILKALPNNNPGYEIIRVVGSKNVVIQDLVVIGDRDTHIGSGGEFGHGIFISGASDNVKIINVTSRDCWGDGFYVGAADFAELRNILISGCVGDNNRRQGCSITSGQYITVENCEFKNTNGTAPEGGIDVEPNVQTDPVQKCRYISIINCRVNNNAGSGIIIEGREIDINSPQNAGLLYFNVENNKSYSNGGDGIFVTNAAFGSVSTNQVSSNDGNGIKASVSVYRNDFAGNMLAFNILSGIGLLQGCFENTVSGNTVSGNVNGILVAGGSESNVVSNNVVTESENGLLVSSSSDNIFTGNTIKDSLYAAIYVSSESSRLNKFVDNYLIDNAEFPTEVSGRHYGADICLTTQAQYNLFKDNVITHSTTQPYNSYYYCRNTGSDNNKFIYDQLGNTTLTRLVAEAGASFTTNEVIELNSLLSFPWNIA